MPDEDPANTLRTYYKEGENDKATSHYITYKLIAETSEISYPGVEVRSLPSQMNSGEFEDVKHTLYHIAISDLSNSHTYHPLLTLDLLSDGEWEIDPENTIIARNEDKVLAQVCYGAGKFATFIYSIKDDTITEIEPNADFAAYQNRIFTGDEPYIFADTVVYDVYDYHDLNWYDWNGNIIKQIQFAQACFYNGKMYYLVHIDEEGLDYFDIYSAELDGTNEKFIGSFREGGYNGNLKCYIELSAEPMLIYQWDDYDGELINDEIPISELKGITVYK